MTAFINPTHNPEHAGEMAASDFLLFVDSNRYLDLYRRDKGKPIIAALVEQTAHIFVTQQIVDEVIRNKITVLGIPRRKVSEAPAQNLRRSGPPVWNNGGAEQGRSRSHAEGSRRNHLAE
jgi:hypothetical protein